MQSLFRASEARLRSARHPSRNTIRRVVICRPNHRLGNLVLLTALVAELRQLIPAAEVDIVLAGDQGAELFRTFPNVRHIYVLHRRMVRHPIAVIRTAMQIRRARYDLAIDPCESSQSSRFLAAIAKAACMIGLPRRPPEATVARTLPRHMAKWPVALLRQKFPAQATTSSDPEYPCLDILLSPAELRSGALALRALVPCESHLHAKTIVGVFADATGAKRYEEAWWMRFLDELHKQIGDCATVEVAPPDGRSRLSASFPTFSSPNLREVAALIANLSCLVSADCGVMHLASASGTPTIGLFSATDPAQYEPYGNGSQAILTNGKSPVEVAQLASTMIEQIRLRGMSTRARFDGIDQASLDSPS